MIEVPQKFERAARRKKLSNRQIEVVYLVGTGLSWKQAAARLGVSIRTVEFHAQSICGRLGTWNCIAAFAQILNFKNELQNS